MRGNDVREELRFLRLVEDARELALNVAARHLVQKPLRTARDERQYARSEERDLALVLQHLQEQTGLTFTRERRSIRILFVEYEK